METKPTAPDAKKILVVDDNRVVLKAMSQIGRDAALRRPWAARRAVQFKAGQHRLQV